MTSNLKFKIWLIIIIIGLALYALYPSFQWYRLSPQERALQEERKGKPVEKILNLGLDLLGGMHIVLEVDEKKLEPGADLKDALARAIEVIRNRVDEFGVREPLIARQGEKWIIVQLPGVKDPEQAKKIIGKTALLEFRLVDESPALEKIVAKIKELGISWKEIYDAQGKLHPQLEELVPSGYRIFRGEGKPLRYYLLKDPPEITGAYLTKAQVELGGDYQMPCVGIEFNKEGAKKFAKITGENVGKYLAIVLDNIVQSVPIIKVRIPDGRAIIEGKFTAEEARNLAIVLRAGALPVPVKIIEERSVGPTLGEDSIRWGIRAIIVAGIVVLLFMLFYYRLAGLIADGALFLNLILLLAAMSILPGATLTLPGLAGILLTIGMAVDANVLIFERIREELRSGKTPRVAIDQGYSRAFGTILDANVTTLIAAFFLLQFGTGAIKGFAVTLSLGIIISMFTAIVVTKTIFELILRGRPIEKLSI
jgi:protein-export membrane protein SecD